MPFKFNPFTANFDKVNNPILNPMLFKGDINANTDFPLIADVENGWFYTISTNVTDNAGVTYTNTGQSFISGDEVAWNGTNWTVLGNSSSGGFTLPPNLVQVDPAEAEIIGKRYTTIANALTYVATQSPTTTNRWGIEVSGNNAESFTMLGYVYIIASESTRLTGNITGGTPGTDYFEYVITGGQIQNINNIGLLVLSGTQLTGTNNNYGILLVTGTTTVDATVSQNGQLMVMNGASVMGGDYSSQSAFIGNTMSIMGGIFPTNTSNNTKVFFSEISGGTFAGIWARMCRFTDGTTFPTYNTGIYKLENSELKDVTVGAGDVYTLNACYGNARTITQTDGVLITANITGMAVNSTGGSYTNVGAWYDNDSSGLISADVQSAIDEMVNEGLVGSSSDTELLINNSNEVDGAANLTYAAGVLTCGTFVITPSSAPTTDYQVANKKYVDDNSIVEDGTVQGQMTFWNHLTTEWLHTETSEFFWDDTNKRIGIGTSTPTKTLEVNGETKINEDLTLVKDKKLYFDYN